MNIIEQQIRMYIQKLLISEADVSKSGYDIYIPGTYLFGDEDEGLKRWRVERINQQAMENGCDRGFLIIATNRNKSVKKKSIFKKPTGVTSLGGHDQEKIDNELLMQDITTTIKSIETYSKYYSKDYRIVLSTPIQRGRRKIYAAWIVDMTTNPLNYFLQLLSKIQQLQRSTTFKISKQATKYILGTNTEIITQSEAIGWTTSIRNYLDELKRTDKELYNAEFPKTKISELQLNSIPDFTKMNRIVIPAETYDVDIKTGLVDIDVEWLYKYGFQTTTFEGKAIVSNDPITGNISFQPVNGSITVAGITSNESPGSFTGEFKDGAPWKGTLTRNNSDDGEESKFIGEFVSTVYVVTTATTPKSKFSLIKLNGTQYYNVKNDSEGKYFIGTWKNGNLDNGKYYSRKPGTTDYLLTGKVINGEYIAEKKVIELKTVIYPYLFPAGIFKGKKAYTSSDPTLSNAYIWVTNKNAWGEILKSDVKLYVNAQITETEFTSKITMITDATIAVKLSDEFKEGTSYVELKTNNDIVVYDAALNIMGDYTPIPADQKKLIWTGATATGKKYYAVHVKDDKGKIMPEVFWIKSSVVAKEIPFIK